MDTRAAQGLSGGIVLAVFGAILYYGVNATVEGLDIDVIGVILMAAGGLLATFGLISAVTAGIRSTGERRVETLTEVSRPAPNTRVERHEEYVP